MSVQFKAQFLDRWPGFRRHQTKMISLDGSMDSNYKVRNLVEIDKRSGTDDRRPELHPALR